MKGNLQFDFQVDKVNHTVNIKREFLANRQIVWDCNTKPELLEQWFAPKPLIAKTKWLEFKEGGTWLFAMIEPTGTEHWSLREFIKITPIEFFSSRDWFSDSEGAKNNDLPSIYWESSFLDQGENTIIEIVATFQSLADLETIIQMGFKEGMTSTLERLDELLLNF